MESVEQNSILKKTSAVIVMITALVFLSFNVFGASPTYVNRYTDGITKSNVTWSVDAIRINTSSLGTSALGGGMETIIYITAYVSNDNNQAALVSLPKFTLDISESRLVSHLYSYGGDFSLSQNALSFYLVPEEEYTYANNNGAVIVPPNKTLYFVGAVALSAQSSGSSTDAVSLTGVHLYDKSNYSVTLGNYSYGDPVDLSPVISYIDTIETLLNNIDDNTDNVENLLGDLVDAITYSGSNPSQLNTNIPIQSATYDYSTNSSIRLNMTANLRYMKPYYLSYDYEYNPTTDTYTEIGTVRYTGILYWTLGNPAQDQYKVGYRITLKNCMPNNTNVVYDQLWSKSFNYAQKSNFNSFIYFKNKVYTNAFINKRTQEVGYLIFHFDLPIGVDPLFSTDPFDVTEFAGAANAITVDNNTYMPASEYEALRDLYLAYSQVNGINDSSDISSDVTDVSDSNHIIEESYYSANASAIEATGLSNYRFSNEQNNGIGQVSSDFMLLWNAIGSWNGVYIFSLTMALATFIMRHGGLFTIKRETSDKGGEDG